MSYLDELISDVRSQIEPDLVVLKEARERLKVVRAAAESFPGALRTYRSGSLAVHTMNEPVTDGDGGLVLNRVSYPNLGPEGKGESPVEVTEALIEHLRPKIREKYPNARMHSTKRGPNIYFGDPIGNVDPTVDLIVAMNRKEGAGLWIPNLKDDSWEASDPEKHVALLNGDSEGFRSTRRKVIRLGKAWNKQFSEPGVSSFQMSVWAYEFVEPGLGVARGLWNVFDKAAERLENSLPTMDPAGVSVSLEVLIDEGRMAKRLRLAATHMEQALDSDDESEILKEMSIVFKNYLFAPETSGLKESITLLATKKPVQAAALGISVAATTGAGFRAYGRN